MNVLMYVCMYICINDCLSLNFFSGIEKHRYREREIDKWTKRLRDRVSSAKNQNRRELQLERRTCLAVKV